MLIPYSAETAEDRWILILQGFILNLDIQSAGKIFKLEQEFFMVHHVGHSKCPILTIAIPSSGGEGTREVS